MKSIIKLRLIKFQQYIIKLLYEFKMNNILVFLNKKGFVLNIFIQV